MGDQKGQSQRGTGIGSKMVDAPISNLTLKNFSCWRGERKILINHSLEIQPGEVFLLKGKNGSGKTTLIKILCGLLDSYAGTLKITEDVSYIGHALGLDPELTVLENLKFEAQLQGKIFDRSLFKHFSLSALQDISLKKLSKGQQRVVALTKLFLSPPKSLWILDEPYEGLDQKAVKILDESMVRHKKEGGSILLSSHISFPPFVTQTLDLDEIKENVLAAA